MCLMNARTDNTDIEAMPGLLLPLLLVACAWLSRAQYSHTFCMDIYYYFFLVLLLLLLLFYGKLEEEIVTRSFLRLRRFSSTGSASHPFGQPVNQQTTSNSSCFSFLFVIVKTSWFQTFLLLLPSSILFCLSSRSLLISFVFSLLFVLFTNSNSRWR